MKQTILYSLLLFCAPFVMIGCGPTKTPLSGVSESSDQSSRITPTKDDSTADKPVAYCNQMKNNWLTANLMAFTDSQGYFRNDYLKLQFTSIDQNFINSNGNIFIRFFRWKANTNGTLFPDNTPLQFRVQSSGGEISLTGYIDGFRWSDMKAYAKSKGISLTDFNEFLKYFIFIINLKDPSADYDALKISAYQTDKSGTSSTLIAASEINGLIPAFYANPKDYAIDPKGDARPQVLADLHPFQNSSNGWSSSDFTTEIQKFCF